MSIDAFGGLDSQTDASERYFAYRVLRSLELSRLMGQMLAAERAGAGPDGIDERAVRAELAERIEAFKRLFAEQIRGQLAELRGSDGTVDRARAVSEWTSSSSSGARPDSSRRCAKPSGHSPAPSRRRWRAADVDVTAGDWTCVAPCADARSVPAESCSTRRSSDPRSRDPTSTSYATYPARSRSSRRSPSPAPGDVLRVLADAVVRVRRRCRRSDRPPQGRRLVPRSPACPLPGRRGPRRRTLRLRRGPRAVLERYGAPSTHDSIIIYRRRALERATATVEALRHAPRPCAHACTSLIRSHAREWDSTTPSSVRLPTLRSTTSSRCAICVCWPTPSTGSPDPFRMALTCHAGRGIDALTHQGLRCARSVRTANRSPSGTVCGTGTARACEDGLRRGGDTWGTGTAQLIEDWRNYVTRHRLIVGHRGRPRGHARDHEPGHVVPRHRAARPELQPSQRVARVRELGHGPEGDVWTR